ncbi:MAG TPA: preprotein translocase subunit SecE [Candidatus Paceibacterota bacterium]|nr:preprotein translocase subunit SecE [Candidatus Paceibacterota bacterium]
MKLTEYIKETRGEMKHVNWPTRSQAMNYTLLVIGVSVATMVVLSIADYVFSLGLEKFILNK